MAIGSLSLAQDHQNVEYHLVTLFEKLDAVRRDATCLSPSTSTPPRPSMQAEVRTLEFWRSIISECLAAFFYVFIVCGAASGAGGSSNNLLSSPTPSVTLATALATGFAIATLTQCFGHVSGAHVNPAVTVAMAVTRNITPLRALMFVTAQCGGGIAGAALLYGVTTPGYMGNLSATVSHLPVHLNAWERFGVEFILTFIVVFTYFVSMDTYRKWLGSSALTIGSAYLACTLVSMPSMNPARTLGPAFVMNKWDNHWVYWFGPMLGGMVSGLIYEFIFNPRRHIRQPKESIDGDSSSIHSDEDPYDELDKPAAPKFHGSTYNTLRGADIYRPAVNHGGPPTPASPTGPGNAYCPSLTSASLYSAPPCKLDRVESLYGGTKSLYAKSPPLTRANLNRSQSVYSKVPPGPVCGREGLPRPGPLVPAQSLYPMRFSQNHNTTNQNVQNQQNQLQQRSESIYGIRGIANVNRGETGGVYGVSHAAAPAGSAVGGKFTAGSNRPESMYGMVVNRRQDSADSSYSSYHSGAGTASGNGGIIRSGNGSFAGGNKCVGPPPPQGFNSTRNDLRQSPQAPQHQLLSPAPTSIINTANSVASYHHDQRLSPNSQY
ncbi:neurogenic protein big brain-like isoform X2 [Periplaneta americana]|uniref:neurogenic protein big brain-like isoform X2 n=1 Tax=Periplaneta americana TaxID=6978 RepID=UPI0037E87712